MNKQPLISPDEVARIIGITKQSVIEAYRKGLIKGYKIGVDLHSHSRCIGTPWKPTQSNAENG